MENIRFVQIHFEMYVGTIRWQTPVSLSVDESLDG